ncbi:MAG: bifunctional DNA primase/polymerase [Planctomycetes bacterium]|nr:bifunctional DNA primase/polymerase [Planctomycetota bacterium]
MASYSGSRCRSLNRREPGNHGYPILPLAGKRPLTLHGVHDASTDPYTIRGWWRRWPTANVGVACGPTSGLLVLDIDPRHGGDATLATMERTYGALPATVEALTGRGDGGRHLYFAWPVGTERVRSPGPGVDALGPGRYLVAPPSVHPVSGQPYTWCAAPGTVALAAVPPGWVRSLARPPPTSPRRALRAVAPDHGGEGRGRIGRETRYGRRAAWLEAGRVRAARVGGRNEALHLGAYRLGQLIAANELREATARRYLADAGLWAGLDPGEVGRAIDGGLAAGMHAPRPPVVGRPRASPLGDERPQ